MYVHVYACIYIHVLVFAVLHVYTYMYVYMYMYKHAFSALSSVYSYSLVWGPLLEVCYSLALQETAKQCWYVTVCEDGVGGGLII